VDAFDNLWSAVRDPAFKGVISFGNRGAIDSVAAFHVTAADGLPSDDIRTIVVDRDNDIWVGTTKGIGIILDPSNPLRPGGIASYRPLNGLTINTIAVDPLNQKWVGTTEGVIHLSPDGTQLLNAFTVETTEGKLIDNDVRSIAVDPLTGTVYFGTTSGLASLTTAAAAPKQSFDELTIYPNPYFLPSTVPLTVDGLVENSSLRILYIDGTLVRDLRTPGGRIGFWDGKDTEGNDVSSGIYIVIAYAEDGSQLAKGKAAVLRR
jgi:ligand-binding sensor domain-containing protein